MRRMDAVRAIAGALMLALALAVPAAARMYGVVFGFSVDRSGAVQSLRVVRIMDPQSRSKDAATIPVPQAFVDAVRKRLAAKHPPPSLREGKPVEVYAWFIYDPSRPDKADIDVAPN